MFSLHISPRIAARIQPVIELRTATTEDDRLSGGTLQVQMWCAAPLDAPRGADFSPSHVRDLDFLWSGRRDSNPRPSPWQRYLAYLCHQPLYTFINVLPSF